MAGLAGKNGTLKIGGTSYPITSWEITDRCEALEDSNSKSNGREEYVAGFVGASGSFTGYLDVADNPITQIEPSTSVTLYLFVDASQKLTVPALMTEFRVTMPVKGKVEYSANFTATAYDLVTDLANIA